MYFDGLFSNRPTIMTTPAGLSTDGVTIKSLVRHADELRARVPLSEVLSRIRCSSDAEKIIREMFRSENFTAPEVLGPAGSVPIESDPEMLPCSYELMFMDGSSLLVLPWGEKVRRPEPTKDKKGGA